MPARQSRFHGIDAAIAATRDQESFIQRLLIDALGWEIDEAATDIEDIFFDWSTSDLRAEGLDQKIADGTIRQLRPMADNPWGIFLIEFKHADAFTTGRGPSLRRLAGRLGEIQNDNVAAHNAHGVVSESSWS